MAAVQDDVLDPPSGGAALPLGLGDGGEVFRAGLLGAGVAAPGVDAHVRGVPGAGEDVVEVVGGHGLGPEEALEPVLAGGGAPGLEGAHGADVLVLADVGVGVVVAAAVGGPGVEELPPLHAPAAELREPGGHEVVLESAAPEGHGLDEAGRFAVGLFHEGEHLLLAGAALGGGEEVVAEVVAVGAEGGVDAELGLQGGGAAGLAVLAVAGDLVEEAEGDQGREGAAVPPGEVVVHGPLEAVVGLLEAGLADAGADRREVGPGEEEAGVFVPGEGGVGGDGEFSVLGPEGEEGQGEGPGHHVHGGFPREGKASGRGPWPGIGGGGQAFRAGPRSFCAAAASAAALKGLATTSTRRPRPRPLSASCWT